MLQSPMIERRCRRSEAPHQALGYWLESVALRHGTRSMAISTVDGLQIAACGDEDGPLLAARGAIAAAGGPQSRDAESLDTTVVTLPGAWQVVVTATGGPCPKQADIAADICRILA